MQKTLLRSDEVRAWDALCRWTDWRVRDISTHPINEAVMPLLRGAYRAIQEA